MRKRTSLDNADARRIAELVRQAAVADEIAISVAIVDESGILLYFERMDGAALLTGDIAIEKARGACLTRRDTKFWEGRALERSVYLRLPILPIQGGIVVEAGGEYVGGVGIAGGTAVQDDAIATACVSAFLAS